MNLPAPSNTLLGGLTPAAFLRTHWQRQPLLVRGAVPDFVNPIEPDELAGLACEAGVRSRLVQGHPAHKHWSVEYGPFPAERFQTLPARAWTLLVFDIDHHWPEAPEWLERFDFIPNWRRDDLMVSYAAQDGSVGPHIDAYDVFLFQAQGRRRWQIQQPPPADPVCLPDLPLAILDDFQPTSDWILEPGDLLYLPPGIPHWGIAQDNHCMTWSIGFRAPAWRDLLFSRLEAILDVARPHRGADPLFTDPGRTASEHPHEIAAADLAALRRGLLERFGDPATLDRFLGEFLTRPPDVDAGFDANKPPELDDTVVNVAAPVGTVGGGAVEEPEGAAPDPAFAIETLWPSQAYRFDPALRRNWSRIDGEITLFVGGHSLPSPDLTAEDAERFCRLESLVPQDWAPAIPDLISCLTGLVSEGRLEPDDESDA